MTANTFARKDGILRVHLIAHGAHPAKSDAFLLEYNGTYLLIDGGSSVTDVSLQYLLELRRTLLAEHPALVEDEACRLHLDLIATHCHIDHVGAWHKHILRSHYLEIGTIYMPPDSALDPYFAAVGADGDTKYRPKIALALREFQPQVKTVTHDFGAENRYSFPLTVGDPASPVLTVCPACHDWGVGEKLEYIIETYQNGERDNPAIPVQVVNNCSDWLHIRHGENTFLFTGDTIKKHEDRYDEAADEMTRTYLPILGHANVVKYIHHGCERDAALADMMAFEPQYLIFGAEIAMTEDTFREKYPDTATQYINCGCQTYIFSSDGKTLSVASER